MRFTVTSKVRGVSPARAYSVFNDRLLTALSPPFAKPLTRHYGGNRPGDRLHFVLKTPLGAKDWTGQVTEEAHGEAEIYFVDEGEHMPLGLTLWRHKHRLIKAPYGTRIRDEVQFETNNGLFTLLLFPALWVQFLYRKPLYGKTIRRMLENLAP